MDQVPGLGYRWHTRKDFDKGGQEQLHLVYGPSEREKKYLPDPPPCPPPNTSCIERAAYLTSVSPLVPCMDTSQKLPSQQP